MQIAKSRNKPFLLLVLQDGQEQGVFSAEFIEKSTQQLIDMSLRIASDHFSIVYTDHVNKACEVVLGISNLGLLDLCANDTDKAIEIIKNKGIVICFRAGWGKYQSLSKISNKYFKQFHISEYGQKKDDVSDIQLKHRAFEEEANKNKELVELHGYFFYKYSTSERIDEPFDQVMMKHEIQKYLNTAVSLLMIDSLSTQYDSNNFKSFKSLLTSLNDIKLNAKIDSAIVTFVETLEQTNKKHLSQLKNMTLLDFEDFRNSVLKRKLGFIPLEVPISILSDDAISEEEDEYSSADDVDDLGFINS
jgi:hypothetical protein